jgi:hypothetical protein
MLGRALAIAALLFVCGQTVLILHFIAHGDLSKPAAPLIEYKDFVTILLTALGVMIAVAAIAAAFAAIWGFEFLRRETRESAEKAARLQTEAMLPTLLPNLVQQQVQFELQGVKTSGDEIAAEMSKEDKP